MKKVTILLAAAALFALPLTSHALSLTRGPYLQMGSDTAITVEWRTDTNSDTVVKYGTSSGSLNLTASKSDSTKNHRIRLTGLTKNTIYFYSVGSSSTTLASGTNYFFKTAPSGAQPTRIWVLGDSGTGNSNAKAVRDAYFGFTGSTHTNLWLMLGDNAYPDGTDALYQSKVFDIYHKMLRKSVLWPTIGNHDAKSADSSTQTGVYYDVFTLPKNAQAGGVASGTEAYYSFDYGNIHFVCLNSQDINRSPTGAMANWLQDDLGNNTKDWLVAFWHHPPYSKGSHNSDNETQLIQMRQNLVPILEDHGVDLVLTGHSHSYERSKFIHGHYGKSGTFNSSHVVQGGSGREDGSGAYQKPLENPADGTVYIVGGSSGKTSGGTLNHPAHWISLNQLASVVLDFDGTRLDVTTIGTTASQVRDYFTIIKGGGGGGGGGGGTTTVTLESIAADDGWVLESGENTDVGGSSDSTGAMRGALRAGDSASRQQYKSILSFGTGGPLPDTATIVSATLKMKRGKLNGSVSNLGTLDVDVRTGKFNGNAALENADFQASADATQVATMSVPSADDQLSTGTFNAAGRSAINKTGKTQVRVYFSVDDDNDSTEDWMGFWAGDSATAGDRPVLEIEYE